MMRNEDQSLLGQRINGGEPTIVSNANSATEKSPFLVEPVRLTPAWEERNLSNHELNFRGLTMERANMEINPPSDRLNLVLFTLILHGIGTLIPWNMFITAQSYFTNYKLDKTPYAAIFMFAIGLASQIPNVLFNWANIFVQMGGNLTTRIIWSLLIEVFVFVLTVILAMVDTSEYPATFFYITIGSVVILNIAGGIYQNTVYGMAAKLPGKYTGAVVLGSNISGTFTSVVNILSYLFSSSKRTAAIYYFITAMFVLLLCFDTYFALPLNKFYRYHELKAENEQKKLNPYDEKKTIPYFHVLKQCFPQLFNVFFVFFITLALFPGVHSSIKRSDSNFFFDDPNMYVNVCCFLTFNVSAMMGSLIASFVQWPSAKYLVYPVVARAVFLPLFVLCNYQPLEVERFMPVYIDSDWVYWGIAIVMGWSSGYLSSLGMMYTPSTVKPQYQATAGMFAAAMLITGIFSGLLLAYIFPYVVHYITW